MKPARSLKLGCLCLLFIALSTADPPPVSQVQHEHRAHALAQAQIAHKTDQGPDYRPGGRNIPLAVIDIACALPPEISAEKGRGEDPTPSYRASQ